FSSAGGRAREAANAVYDRFRAKDGTTLSEVLSSRKEAAPLFQEDLLKALGDARPDYGTGVVKTLEGSDLEMLPELQDAAKFCAKEWVENAGPVRIVARKGAGGDAYLRPEIAKDHVPTIMVGKGDQAALVHEMAHWLEDANPELSKETQAYFAARTEG